MRPSIKNILKSGGLAAVIAVAANVGIWLVATAMGGSALQVIAVAINSILGLLVGGLIYALLARFTKRANNIFTVVSIVFLVVYAYAPISAMTTPPAGIEPFNVTTVIATELMHVVAGALAIWAYTKRAEA